MPRLSRKQLDKTIIKELKENFSSLISSLNNPNHIEQFFNDFLTNEEKGMLMKRLMLHVMLENGYKNYQIESMLGISRETVRTHKNIWEKGGAEYKYVVGKIAKKEKVKQFLRKVEKVLKPLDLALRAKTNMKARANFAQGDWFEN